MNRRWTDGDYIGMYFTIRPNAPKEGNLEYKYPPAWPVGEPLLDRNRTHNISVMQAVYVLGVVGIDANGFLHDSHDDPDLTPLFEIQTTWGLVFLTDGELVWLRGLTCDIVMLGSTILGPLKLCAWSGGSEPGLCKRVVQNAIQIFVKHEYKGASND